MDDVDVTGLVAEIRAFRPFLPAKEFEPLTLAFRSELARLRSIDVNAAKGAKTDR